MSHPVVQCGWCPVIMAEDWTVILLHFAEAHGVANGSYSIQYIKGPGWDVAELEGLAGSQGSLCRTSGGKPARPRI